jgi:hypothetical protein
MRSRLASVVVHVGVIAATAIALPAVTLVCVVWRVAEWCER